MTATTFDAKVTFTPAAQAGLKSAPTPAATIKIKGKTFKIDYIRFEKDGLQYDVTNLSQAEVKALAEQCRNIFEKVITDGEVPKQFALKFERQNEVRSLTSGILGVVTDRFKTPLMPLELKTIEVQKGKGKAQVIEIKAEDRAKVQAEVHMLDQMTLKVFTNHQLYTRPVVKRPPEQTQLQKLILETIQEAGTDGHKCAALSIAKKEIALSTPEKIKDEYDLKPELVEELKALYGDKEKIEYLSNALIQKAADTIGSQHDENGFIKDTELQDAPCFAAVRTALEAHQKADPGFVIPSNRKEAVAKYADLVRKHNVMLDLPFLLALKKPFAVIRQLQGNYAITEISDKLEILGKVENFDLSKANILFYNGTNHYQAVIARDKAHTDAIRTLLKQNIEERFWDFIRETGSDDLTTKAFKNCSSDFMKLIKLYPAARQEIIQKLKDRYEFTTEIDSLDTEEPERFAQAVRLRMSKSIP